MKYIVLIAFLGVVLSSCNDAKKKSNENKPEEKEEKLTMENLIERSVMSQLQIPATENFVVDIHKAHFNDDGIEDAVVLVNRAQFAKDEAIRNNRVKSMQEVSYTGNYNALFYYDGGREVLSRPITITSNAMIPLKTNIENIHSEAYKDFTIDYRIMESCYRNFYTIINGVPKMVFQWGVFDYENPESPVLNYFEYAKGSYSLAKDILVYPGKMNSSLPKDLNADFDYQIDRNGALDKLFFYHPKEGKYFTPKK